MILLSNDSEPVDRYFQVRFERFQWLATPFPSHFQPLTPEVLVGCRVWVGPTYLTFFLKNNTNSQPAWQEIVGFSYLASRPSTARIGRASEAQPSPI
jgi:hypothetical protein